jgi:prophage antirepressor-like protein
MSKETPMAVPTANSVTPFLFKNDEVRTAIAEDGQVWFCAKDVCRVLNLTWSGSTLQKLPKKWVAMLRHDTPGGVQEVAFVNEPGVFKLIFRSTKPEAEKFANWVCEEVLPSLRKHGSFGALSVTDEDRLTKTAVAVFKRLTETNDACEHSFLLERAKSLMKQLGQPMPDFTLLGTDISQLELPGV